jgi:hypothetical protein
MQFGAPTSDGFDKVKNTRGAHGAVAVISYHFWQRPFHRDPKITDAPVASKRTVVSSSSNDS